MLPPLQPTEAAIARITEDVQRGLYDSFHLNFSTHLPRPLMEKLAAGEGGGEGEGQACGEAVETLHWLVGVIRSCSNECNGPLIFTKGLLLPQWLHR